MGSFLSKVRTSVPPSPTHDLPTDPAQESPVASRLNELPHELKSRIASRLDQDSSKALRLTNKGFRHVGAEPITKLTIPATEIEHLDRQLKDFCNVSTGIITGRLGDTELAQLAGMSLENRNKITHISLHENISDAGLAHLKDLMKLQSLDFRLCTSITDLTPLQSLTQLQSLNLAGCHSINDAGLTPLQRLTQLQSLNLAGCHSITDLTPLQRLTKLQSLNLVGCDGIANLAPLQGLTQLQSLDLRWCLRITDAAADDIQAVISNCDVIR